MSQFSAHANRRTTRSLLTIVACLTVVIAMLVSLQWAPGMVEMYYSQGLYPIVATITQCVFNFFPFSIGDLLYMIIVIVLIVVVVKLVLRATKKQWKPAGRLLLQTTIGIEMAVIIFYLFWGLNYFRPPAAQRLGLQDSCCSTTDIRLVAGLLIDSANASRARLLPADLRQGDAVIFAHAVQAMQAMGKSDSHFNTYFPRVKPSILSYALNYMGVSGHYNPFTSEAQINDQMPVFLRPVTACHEMSHQIGYNAEDEANFGGFVAGVSSREKLLKYSAFYMGVSEFMFELRMRDTLAFNELKARISPEVKADFKADREYWDQYRGGARLLSSLFYDRYLKMNNQPEGLRTYNRMVKLVIAWYRRKTPVFHELRGG